MLQTLAIVLVVLWLLGMVGSYTMGGFIHVLLVLAIVMVLFRDRLAECGIVMSEVLNVPDNVPQEILDKAECVVVIPSMTKVALGVGGSYGRGAMVCRSGKAFDGSWGALVDVLQKRAPRNPPYEAQTCAVLNRPPAPNLIA